MNNSTFTPVTITITADTPEKASYLFCLFGDNPDSYMKSVAKTYAKELGICLSYDVVTRVAAAGWELYEDFENAGYYDVLSDLNILDAED